jgi:hypothetical protein
MQTRTYQAPGLTAQDLAEKMRLWFAGHEYETQLLRLPDGILVVQGYRDDIWRVAVGLAAALTVQIKSLPDQSLEVTIGAGAWADKFIVAGIGLLLFLPLVLPAAWGTWEQYQLDQEVWNVIESALPTGTTPTEQATPQPITPVPPAELPTSWFSEETNEVYSAQFFQRMESWQRAIADGKIDPTEIQAQGERVMDLLKRAETSVSDEAHAKLTETFSELAVLQGMQAYAIQQHISENAPNPSTAAT